MIIPNSDFILVARISVDSKSQSGLVFGAVEQWQVVSDGVEGIKLPKGTIVFLTKAPLMIKHDNQDYGLARQDTLAGWVA